MLSKKPLGAAIAEAMRLKGVGPTEVAAHFNVQPPSVHGWKTNGSIDKDKINKLVDYFRDVVGPEHWGLEADHFAPKKGRADDKKWAQDLSEAQIEMTILANDNAEHLSDEQCRTISAMIKLLARQPAATPARRTKKATAKAKD